MPSVNYIVDGELYHHGIKGQNWGERRFQYDDGSLTPEGYRRYYGESGKKKFKFGEARKDRLKSRENIEKNKQKTKENIEISKHNTKAIIEQNKQQSKENIKREKIRQKANIRREQIKKERLKDELEIEKIKKDETEFIANTAKEITPILKDIIKDVANTAVRSLIQSKTDVKKEEARAIIEKNSQLAFNMKYDKKRFKEMQKINMKNWKKREESSQKSFLNKEVNNRRISDISLESAVERQNFLENSNKIKLVDLGLDKLDTYNEWEEKKKNS